jgi:outer membrane protein TolC
MKVRVLTSILSLLWLNAVAQLTIDGCQQKARDNFPLIRQLNLIEQAKDYNLANAQKGYLPQFQFSAKATYQSAAVAVSLPIEGFERIALSKDQYLLAAEVNQVLYDGGAIRAQKELIKANTEVETQQLETALYAVREQVNQLFFAILLFDAQLAQNRILAGELQRNYETMTNYVANGLANAIDLDAIRVEQLNVSQLRIQLTAARTAYLEVLGLMTGDTYTREDSLIAPQFALPDISMAMQRPELHLFDAQSALLSSQRGLINAAHRPKIGLFLQGGAGRPGLNMLNDKPEPFYIGGIRMAWNFGAYYTLKNDMALVALNIDRINTQRELFLYNTRIAQTRELSDIRRITDLLQTDEQIIELRENIRKAAEAKVANGTMSTADLLQEISREDLARQAKINHEIDLLAAACKLQHTSGIK